MAGKVKVLIVDDNDDTRDGTRRLLEYEDNIEIVGFADNGQTAVDQALDLKPMVILMDINMPVMDGLTATEIIKRELPSTQIIVVSVQDDAHYMRQAFQKGAFDFVAKPITSAELSHAIERASAEYDRARATQAMQQQQVVSTQPGRPSDGMSALRSDAGGSVIAVMGLKGGVGKTTVAVSLGVGLARMLQQQNKKVIIVDGNLLFGDMAVFLNTRGQYNVNDAVEMASDAEGIDLPTLETVLVSHESGAKLLLAPAKPSDARPVSDTDMANMLTQLKRDFHYVIVDTSPTFDTVSAAVIRAADKIIVMATATMPALKDARFLFDELITAEYSKENILLVLNEIDKATTITPEQIGNFLKHPVLAQIPLDLTAVEAVNKGIPLIAMDSKRSPAAKPLMNLVQLVRDSIEKSGEPTGQVAAEEPARKRFGLFGG